MGSPCLNPLSLRKYSTKEPFRSIFLFDDLTNKLYQLTLINRTRRAHCVRIFVGILAIHCSINEPSITPLFMLCILLFLFFHLSFESMHDKLLFLFSHLSFESILGKDSMFSLLWHFSFISWNSFISFCCNF